MKFNHELNVDDETIDNAIEIAMDNTLEQLITMDWIRPIRFKIDLQEEDNKYMYTATSGLLAAKYFNYRHPMPKITQTYPKLRDCQKFIEAVNEHGNHEGDWSDNWQAIITWAKELIEPPGYLKQPDDMLIGINYMDKSNQYRPPPPNKAFSLISMILCDVCNIMDADVDFDAFTYFQASVCYFNRVPNEDPLELNYVSIGDVYDYWKKSPNYFKDCVNDSHWTITQSRMVSFDQVRNHRWYRTRRRILKRALN